MKIRPKLLQEYLQSRNLSAEQFAEDTGINLTDVELLLGGHAVDVRPATLFVFYFGSDKAQVLIDWLGMGIKNPLAKEV